MFVYTDFCFAECQIGLSFTEYGIFKRKKNHLFTFLTNIHDIGITIGNNNNKIASSIQIRLLDVILKGRF